MEWIVEKVCCDLWRKECIECCRITCLISAAVDVAWCVRMVRKLGGDLDGGRGGSGYMLCERGRGRWNGNAMCISFMAGLSWIDSTIVCGCILVIRDPDLLVFHFSAYEKQLQEYEITVFGSGGPALNATDNKGGFDFGYPRAQHDPSNVIFGSALAPISSTYSAPTFTPLVAHSSASPPPSSFVFGASNAIGQNGSSQVIGDAQMDNL